MIKKYQQHGFTLIELLIAMLIFAMLALSGWQIMDALTKSRERAKIQIEQLSDLQYAYLQLSQDFSQVSNYVVVPTNIVNQNLTNDVAITPTFRLNSQQIDFVRFAGFEPRLNPPPSFAKVRYIVQDDKLVKERSYQLHDDNSSSRSVLLSKVKDVKWQAWSATPSSELVSEFPDSKTLAFVKQQSAQVSENMTVNPFQPNNTTENSAEKTLDLLAYQQLPKGVTLSFTYHDQPIVWQFAIAEKAPSFVVVPNKTTGGV